MVVLDIACFRNQTGFAFGTSASSPGNALASTGTCSIISGRRLPQERHGRIWTMEQRLRLFMLRAKPSITFIGTVNIKSMTSRISGTLILYSLPLSSLTAKTQRLKCRTACGSKASSRQNTRLDGRQTTQVWSANADEDVCYL